MIVEADPIIAITPVAVETNRVIADMGIEWVGELKTTDVGAVRASHTKPPRTTKREASPIQAKNFPNLKARFAVMAAAPVIPF